MNINDSNLNRLIDLAIDEDIKSGDITTKAITDKDNINEAIVKVKQDCVIAGLNIILPIISKFDEQAKCTFNNSDGDECKKNDIVAIVVAKSSALLSTERTILNFLQRMSGIATKTRRFINEIGGLNTKILDTRKTVPGHRFLDKYSVKVGGGENHRIGLFDMVMIKDNHIKLAGSIKRAVNLVRKSTDSSIKIEVETSSLNEVKEALDENVDIVMLDNMNLDEIEKAVAICKGKVLLEVSGNVSLQNVRKIAETGIDYISVGELTHSVEATDISMKLKK
jgi:nicotinate-nucleotide pyrophosphorylase (carboxylating)